MRRFLRKFTVEMRVYTVLTLLLAGTIFWLVYSSGWLQPKTFDETIFDEQACLEQKQAFDHRTQPRKAIEDVENLDHLIVVKFNNMGQGDDLFGLIDVDGSVVVEPTFENMTGYYNQIIRVMDADRNPFFYDLELTELPIRQASRAYYDAKALHDLYREINMNPVFTLKHKSVLSSDFVAAVEQEAKLELFYMNYYMEPTPFYSMRMLSSVHERVFIVLDKNLNMIIDEYFVNPVYFEDNGIAKVERVCTIAYLNMDGEYIWYVD
jgi:hypothetical protein